MSEAHQTVRWVDAMWGERTGWAVVAYGIGPHRDANGKYRHRSFDQHFYRWPGQRGALLNDVARELATSAVDIYVAPHLRASEKRTKHTALPPLWLHADIDGNVGDPQLWNQLDPIRVQSGTPGHEHGYIALSRPLDLPTWDRLQRALRDRLGGDTDSKIADNDMLRVPGTLNYKPTAPPTGTAPGEPSPVVLLPGGGRVCELEELAELLGVDLSAPNPASNGHHGDLGPLADVPAPAALPHMVTAALERHRDNPDRSAVWQAVINACRGSALTREQTYAVLRTHRAEVIEKYNGRETTEFDRSWGKATTYWENTVGGILVEWADAVRIVYGENSPEMHCWIYDNDALSVALLTAPAAINSAATASKSTPRTNDHHHDVKTQAASDATDSPIGLPAPTRSAQQYHA
ncbi:MAG: hypothetical protein ACRDSH_19110, partial [Pseudonocardiaceae bacterium]